MTLHCSDTLVFWWDVIASYCLGRRHSFHFASFLWPNCTTMVDTRTWAVYFHQVHLLQDYATWASAVAWPEIPVIPSLFYLLIFHVGFSSKMLEYYPTTTSSLKTRFVSYQILLCKHTAFLPAIISWSLHWNERELTFQRRDHYKTSK